MADSIEAIIFSRPGETSLACYISSLWAAESGSYIDDVKVWICPSVTCFVSVLKICGCTCFDIMVYLSSLPQLSQMFVPFRNPLNLGQNLESVKNIISKILISKWDTIPTLEELYVRTGVVIVGIGLCLDRQQIEYIHRETYPSMSVLDLICLSLATPGIYHPYKINNELWIDGSIVEPFSPRSIVLETGKVLAITSKQSKISFQNKDPLSQSKNIMRIFFESLRQIVVIPNMSMIEITPPTRGGNSSQLRAGWNAFTDVFNVATAEIEGAELQS